MRIFLISLWNTFFTKSSIKTIENKKLAVSYESRFFKRLVRKMVTTKRDKFLRLSFRGNTPIERFKESYCQEWTRKFFARTLSRVCHLRLPKYRIWPESSAFSISNIMHDRFVLKGYFFKWVELDYCYHFPQRNKKV